MIIVSDFIAKHELKPLEQRLSMKDIIVGCRKVSANLAIEIKPPAKLSSARFFKVRIGKHTKARMIVFIVMDNQNIVPLLIRQKKDKIWGMNMSANNPQVIAQLKFNLDNVIEDIKNKRFKEIHL